MTPTETSLFDAPARTTGKFQEEFEAFDAANPDVWREFREMALRLIKTGWKHYGAKSIIEAIRFHRDILKGEGEQWKINNNFTAYYARKFMDIYLEYEGFFETRGIKN